MTEQPISAEDVVRRIKTKKIGAIPVTFHDMQTIALVEMKDSTGKSVDLEPIALVITDEIFSEIKPLFDAKVQYRVEGWEKQWRAKNKSGRTYQLAQMPIHHPGVYSPRPCPEKWRGVQSYVRNTGFLDKHGTT